MGGLTAAGGAERLARASRSRLPFVAGCAALILGAIGLLGWQLDLVVLRTFLSGPISIQPLTALSLALAGASLLLIERRTSPRVASALALILLLFAAQALAQFIAKIEFGTDYWLFSDEVAAQSDSPRHPGRMAEMTALCFLLAGACLVLAPRSGRAVDLVHSAAATTILILSSTALLAYLLGSMPPSQMLGFTDLAMPTALGLFLLSLGLLAVRPRAGWVGLLLADSIGGSAARRLLPVVIIVPVAITWLVLRGSDLHFYPAPVTLVVVTTLSVLLLSILTLWAASRFDALDAVRRTEAALRESERRVLEYEARLALVSRASTLGAMGTTLAHELNQPLGAAVNYLSAATRLLEVLPSAPGGVREAIEGASSSTRRAAEIIHRLRGFLRSGSLEKTPQDLGPIIEDAFTLFAVGGRLEGIETRLSLDPAAGPVLCDPVQIQQVMLNLIGNAADALAAVSDRRIEVATRRVAGLNGEPDMAEISIADTGPGLGEAILHRPFGSFKSSKPGGMGIGLSISETIVSAHSGRIWAENGGGGAVFRFTLPICGEGPSRPSPA